MEKSKYTDSKRFMVVRCRETLEKDPKKKADYPYQVKVREEVVDRDGDIEITHRYYNSRIKIEKPGEYEFYVRQGAFSNENNPKEVIQWCKLEELRK